MKEILVIGENPLVKEVVSNTLPPDVLAVYCENYDLGLRVMMHARQFKLVVITCCEADPVWTSAEAIAEIRTRRPSLPIIAFPEHSDCMERMIRAGANFACDLEHGGLDALRRLLAVQLAA